MHVKVKDILINIIRVPCFIGSQYKKQTCSGCDGKTFIDLRDKYKYPVCNGKGSFDHAT